MGSGECVCVKLHNIALARGKAKPREKVGHHLIAHDHHALLGLRRWHMLKENHGGVAHLFGRIHA